MDIPAPLIVTVVRWFLDRVDRIKELRRRHEAISEGDRLTAYVQFLSTMDRAYAAFEEYIPLRQGLRWWNGSQRLKIMRSTGLDKRLLEIGRGVCESIEAVRVVGSKKAVGAAESLLEVVALPAAELEASESISELDLSAFSERRQAMIGIIREDRGAKRLQVI